MKRTLITGIATSLSLLVLTGCGGSTDDAVASPADSLDAAVAAAIEAATPAGKSSLILPDSTNFNAIPQDPANTITAEKITLGQMLYHDTGMASGINAMGEQSWSCATCHHAAAGFKAGVPQGIGEGGRGFGMGGADRVLADGFDVTASMDSGLKPDLQPIATPTVLNAAFQDVMLWNGQFGNSPGSINEGISTDRLATENTPKAENARMLSGVEIQAIAGLKVHRLDPDNEQSPLHVNENYQSLFNDAFGLVESDDYRRDAGLAIAAYERTILANKAPFQQWLRGDSEAMSDREKRGATLFFGKAGCAGCHQGPALSSQQGAGEDAMFFAIGMNDLDSNMEGVHGSVDQNTRLGRGGFTGEAGDNYKFKIPQLYNLTDNRHLGHGASFTSVEAVIRYKNNAVAENTAASDSLDARFQPLGLSDNEIDDLTTFITDSLYDAELDRYVPGALPSGACITVDATGNGCEGSY